MSSVTTTKPSINGGGSDVGNILKFSERYGEVDEVRLQENFRSSRGIVETAHEFISQNTLRLDKAMLPTDTQPYEPGDLVALAIDTPEEEAEFIAQTDLVIAGSSLHGSGRY